MARHSSQGTLLQTRLAIQSGLRCQVERWREALLWTYIVANIGTINPGLWATEARERIADLFGLGSGREDVDQVELHKGERWTLSPHRFENVFKQAGWEPPKATEMLFCESRLGASVKDVYLRRP